MRQAKPKLKPKNQKPPAEKKVGKFISENRKLEFLAGLTKSEKALTLQSPIPRIAVFAGRSNVGKSSLLNALTQSTMARVSQEPGKTREMNFFAWKPTIQPHEWWLLVDLPGYGYARVAQKLRAQWGEEINRWLRIERRIEIVVMLVDGRHGLLDNDIELLEFLQTNNLPHVVAFTKMDKWKSKNQRIQAERQLREIAEKAKIQEYLFVSSQQKDGVTGLAQFLRKKNKRQET